MRRIRYLARNLEFGKMSTQQPPGCGRKREEAWPPPFKRMAKPTNTASGPIALPEENWLGR
jgi:hypothetical protein